ncbi:Transcription-coupled repair protein CSB/RAD26 (contains SNF2 family DNA-dependent ATPase domain) [Handroanthus impetiginosus]|uniref:Transcription-coupled repair protein CSB/RAD26 (Contains SNF2 family DNA-dependent ATPase domain) n=1 Tax=Handroanthus impetiginosus TaxID=429701 RepID=A0A2G9GIE5_9LAMI|nr:Transcription-coupled repair protein CSB/RAD26 (contains SNF2 family DNA-dependent ATPase domain) [Handroanthus impetiginosus]
MDEEEEDRVLLSTLGVTSANPEDIERGILEKARKDAEDSNKVAGGREEETLDGTKSKETFSSSHGNLVNKLRAVQLEIDALTSTVEQLESLKGNKDDFPDGEEETEHGNAEEERNVLQASPNDLTLQHALAADRLKSLIKAREQLEKEIPDSSKNNRHDRLIRNLVKEEPKRKGRFKEVDKKSQNQKKRLKRVSLGEDDDFDAALNAASAGFVETERDELIRKGILTPFHKLKGYERRIQEPGSSSRDVASEDAVENDDLASSSIARAVQLMSEASQARPTTKMLDPELLPRLDAPTLPFKRLRKPLQIPRSLETESEEDKRTKSKRRRPQPGKKWRKLVSREDELEEEGDWKATSNEDDGLEDVEDVDDEEPPFVTLEGGLKIPETIFSQLFDYQKVGVQWLWELHCQKAGGIIGDEMGLGKTVQVLAFLGSLHFSGMYKPSIIVCPVTLLRQWKREARKWYPGFHVELLHDSAQDMPSRKKRSRSNNSDCDSEDSMDSDYEEKTSSKNTKKWDSLINRVLRSQSGLLITTYEQLRLQGEKLLDIEWGYAVLDEGHRIRNPNAEITLVCKQLQTVHRIIMTGAPIQNKLSELWSLFDFVFPGKLGVLPVFEAEFAVPISVGGYANATPLQVSTAYRCAVVLRDLIMPYLLRRMKVDVDAHLPKKTEHVLFCSLTPEQRSVYRAFLASSEVEQIFNGGRNSLSGIDVMRKICNHPDLLEREHSHGNPDYGNPKRSGKMKVVAEVLNVWKEQGHRVLLFTQTQQMLDIIENFLIAGGYNYRRMDGLTPVKQRMALIDEFNNLDDIFIFILTTKVGGLGTNLTGANRVIIFDPDWNPSTDTQARERAWRIGQKRDVTVYRLITRGTIEEKVYQRQIYKHYLTNKILKNPQQRRFFKARDMKDLFTLNDDGDGGSTETSSIFSQLAREVNIFGDSRDRQGEVELQKPSISGTDGSPAESGSNLMSDNIGEDKANHSDMKADEETNFLKSLFDSHGIHSAVNHDAIMNAHDEDKMKLEEHASKVAQRAAEALRQSRMLRSRESITVPTWTGKSGSAGAPSSVKRKFGSTVNPQLASTSRPSEDVPNNNTSRPNGFAAGAYSGRALSSAELLARIKGNQEQAVSDGLEHQFVTGAPSNGAIRSAVNGHSRPSNKNSGVQPELLIRQICTFIQRSGGSTSSASIVDHFRDRIPSKDLPLFKNLLKEIATLEKSPDGSYWVLKPEYRDQ